MIHPEHTQQEQEPTYEQIPEDVEVSKVFKGFPENVPCLELSRTRAAGGRPEYLEDIAPGKFSLGYVAEKFGGGLYILTGKYSNGDSVKSRFEIAGEPFPVKRLMPEIRPGLHAQQVEQMKPVELPPGAGMQELVGAMMGMMKNMMLELKSSETDMLMKMKLYKELFAPADSAPRQDAPFDQAFNMIQKGMELGQMASGDSGSMGMMLVKELKEPVLRIVEALTPKRGPVPVQPVVQPGAVPPHTTEPPSMNMIFTKALEGIMPMLVTGAAKKSDPGFYADLLLEQIPELYYATAQEMLSRPDWFDVLCSVNQNVKDHGAWFFALRSEILFALTEGPDAAESIQPEPASNPSTNGTTAL